MNDQIALLSQAVSKPLTKKVLADRTVKNPCLSNCSKRKTNIRGEDNLAMIIKLLNPTTITRRWDKNNLVPKLNFGGCIFVKNLYLLSIFLRDCCINIKTLLDNIFWSF
jgi:hypothetical protein